MKTQLDCIACLANQAIKICKEALPDQEDKQLELARLAIKKISDSDLSDPPPVIASKIQGIIKKEVNSTDLYKEVKDQANQLVLSLLPKLETIIEQSADKQETALMLAIGGNIIDVAIGNMPRTEEIQEAVEQSLNIPIDGNIDGFIKDVKQARKILYLCDNTGEICLDKLLIKQLGPEKICAVVRGMPTLNDATLKDAKTCGLTDIVAVIDNGTDIPGTILNECPESFQKRFAEADLIISKGQGNYETLNEIQAPIYFLLKVKCDVVAELTNLKKGSLLLKKSDSFTRQNQ
ncbi:MAG: DUF89 family protein [Deltaproteobacteria bacterium]|jgi:damage-control phosphatase, subfamily I|nr:DUF89 family protein [Deltaproteobacteria bacterium]MBT4526605.1 DUF89 family protein [Deltaproteobacteria bacterium]